MTRVRTQTLPRLKKAIHGLLIVTLLGLPFAAPAAADGAPPTTPTDLRGDLTGGDIVLSWSASSDDGNVDGYNVYRDSDYHATVHTASFREPSDGESHTYYVTAFDNEPRLFSGRSAEWTFTPGGAPELGGPGEGFPPPDEEEWTPWPTPTPVPQPRAIVSIGDSFISGMGSRWLGNSHEIPAQTDLGAGVYDGDGCHRSTQAEVHVSGIPGLQTFNIACAGATTTNIGAQARWTAGLTATHDIEMIVVSIGGNDINFAGRLYRCAERFFEHKRPCYKRWAGTSLPGDVEATLKPSVTTALATIRQNMRAAGVDDDSYRLVLQSYPSPLPAGARYSSSRKWRGRGGCPFHSEDMRWAYRTATPMIDEALREVAAASPGVEFLSLKSAFEGKEVCAVGLEHVTSANLGQPEKHEWVRWGARDVRYHLIPSQVEQGGSAAESMHPNAYGHQALGRCLRLVWERPGHSYHSCTNNGTTPRDMSLSSS